MNTPLPRPQFQREILFLTPALLLPFCATLFYFVLLAGHPLAQVFYALTKVFMLVWPLACLLIFEKQRCLQEQDAPATNRRFIHHFVFSGDTAAKFFRPLPFGLFSGAALSLAVLAFYFFTPLGAYAHAHSAGLRGHLLKMQVLGRPLLEIYLPASVFISLINSLLEEYYWRWFVFGRLQKILRREVAILLASCAFAAHHFVILGCYFPAFGTVLFGLGVGVGGAIWCWQFSRQHSLAGVWISHLVVDATFLWIGYGLLFGEK